MEHNHDSILVNAMLENYEKPLYINLIDNNPHTLTKITLTLQQEMKIREITS